MNSESNIPNIETSKVEDQNTSKAKDNQELNTLEFEETKNQVETEFISGNIKTSEIVEKIDNKEIYETRKEFENNLAQIEENPISNEIEDPLNHGQALDSNLEEDEENNEDNIGNEQLNENDQQQQVNQPTSEDHLLNVFNSITNTHLISEESIESFRALLCSTEDSPFHNLTTKDSNLKEKFLNLIKEKSKLADQAIGETLSFYHRKLIDSQLGHLDKLMRILKSTKKELHLKRIKPKNNSNNGTIISEKTELNQQDKTENDEFIRDPEVSDLENNSNFKIADIFNLNNLGSMLLNRKSMPEYNPKNKSLKFQIDDKYEIHLMAVEDRNAMKKSYLDRLPIELFINYIFPYFTSMELFKLRSVCNEWREMVRSIWHVVFKREMLEQIIAAELCNDIEVNFKLMQIRTPFFQKFGMFMRAICEVIEWESLKQTLNSEGLDNRYKLVVISLFKLLGFDVYFDKLVDFKEEYWEPIKPIALENLQNLMNMVFEPEFSFKSNEELEQVNTNFLNCIDISAYNIRLLNDKNLTMLHLFLRQLIVFAQLKNSILLSQNYVMVIKDRLKEVSNRWTSKKGFLEGAYKILLFKFVKIQNGQVALQNDNEGIHKEHLKQKDTNEFQEVEDKLNEHTDEYFECDQNNETDNQIKPHECSHHVINNEQLKESPDTNPSDKNIISDPVPTNITFGEDPKSSSKIDDSPYSAPFTIEFTRDNLENQPDSMKIDLDKFDPNNNEHNHQVLLLLHAKLEKLTNKLKNGIITDSKVPDYIIKKDGTETRIFLDDETRIELLVQKLIKFHILYQAINSANTNANNEFESEERDLENSKITGIIAENLLNEKEIKDDEYEKTEQEIVNNNSKENSSNNLKEKNDQRIEGEEINFQKNIEKNSDEDQSQC